MYKLFVEKIENLSEEELKKINERRYYPNEIMPNNSQKSDQILMVQLTEDEFKAIKKAVIEVIK